MNRSGIHACPQGFYCPANTGYNWMSCPLGTYGAQKGLKEERECKPCDAGKYCNQLNSTSPNGYCAPGYYCVSGVNSPIPQLGNIAQCPINKVHLSIGGECTPGSFCKLGSHATTGIRHVYFLSKYTKIYKIHNQVC